MINTILQISKLEPGVFDEITPSFHRLPETNHADGKYRLRRYSKVHANLDNLNEGKPVDLLKGSVFNQSKEFNKHQGDIPRRFESIEDEVIESEALRHLILTFYEACKLYGDHQFEIHQFRIICRGGATQIAPEGWHQDGYDHVAIVGIGRENIIGGELMLSASKTEAPFFTATLDTGTMVVLKDNFLWHNARVIQAIDDDKPAWLDAFVITLRVND